MQMFLGNSGGGGNGEVTAYGDYTITITNGATVTVATVNVENGQEYYAVVHVAATTARGTGVGFVGAEILETYFTGGKLAPNYPMRQHFVRIKATSTTMQITIQNINGASYVHDGDYVIIKK